jgi:hypothetical protein
VTYNTEEMRDTGSERHQQLHHEKQWRECRFLPHHSVLPQDWPVVLTDLPDVQHLMPDKRLLFSPDYVTNVQDGGTRKEEETRHVFLRKYVQQESETTTT